MQSLGKLFTKNFAHFESDRRRAKSKVFGTKPPRPVSGKCSASHGSRLGHSFDLSR